MPRRKLEHNVKINVKKEIVGMDMEIEFASVCIY
jgi:hypothetical protein